MNSTSSTSPSAAASARVPAQENAEAAPSPLKPWQFYLTASFLAAAAAVWLSPPSSPAALLFISMAIGAGGASAAALHTLLTAVTGRTPPEDGVSESLRAALEREKLLTLRSIKDLQFDAAMGKVSQAEAATMEARLRERAAAIMAQLDGREAVRARVEEDLARRQATGDRRQATGLCSCGTANDADARFCKNCGAKL
jgi:hypothetical protein